MVHISILEASNSDNNCVLEKKGTIHSINHKSIQSKPSSPVLIGTGASLFTFIQDIYASRKDD